MREMNELTNRQKAQIVLLNSSYDEFREKDYFNRDVSCFLADEAVICFPTHTELKKLMKKKITPYDVKKKKIFDLNVNVLVLQKLEDIDEKTFYNKILNELSKDNANFKAYAENKKGALILRMMTFNIDDAVKAEIKLLDQE